MRKINVKVTKDVSAAGAPAQTPLGKLITLPQIPLAFRWGSAPDPLVEVTALLQTPLPTPAVF
jgi:hypothetical protein